MAPVAGASLSKCPAVRTMNRSIVSHPVTVAPCTTSSGSHRQRPVACKSSLSHLPWASRTGLQRPSRWICAASDLEDGPSTSHSTSTNSTSNVDAPIEGVRIKRTMADLDALLGIQEDDKAKASNSAQAMKSGDFSISPTALGKMADADAQRMSRGDASKVSPAKTDIEDQFQKIIDKARKLADEQQAKGGTTSSSEQEQAALKREFETLLSTITKPVDVLDKDDLKRLKDAAFGPLTFWVTETRPITDAERTGMLIRGNLRDDRNKVFELLCAKVQELFDGKYEVFMVEDADEEGTGSSMSALSSRDLPSSSIGRATGIRDGPRVAFQIIPAAQALPPQTDNLQRVAAAVLGALVVLSCLQLALASNINKLPKEALEWFANPANLDSGQLPPVLENWDPTPYLDSAIPVLTAVLGVNLAHEVGHRIMAAIKGVKLGPSFFIPFSEVGTFGAITPITSLLKDRQALWDVAAAGPAAGALAAGTMLLVGLAQSAGVDPTDTAAAADLISIPSPLFQGSLMMGGLTRLVLGAGALKGSTVLVSPLVIAGWCGLITTALNMLPVGSLDGGRMVQAAYGRQALALSSFFTYVGLGLGLLGSSLALPFGLYVIICQRTAEKFIQDTVTPPDGSRITATSVGVLAAILVLLPMAPELAEAFGIGPSSPFL